MFLYIILLLGDINISMHLIISLKTIYGHLSRLACLLGYVRSLPHIFVWLLTYSPVPVL